MILRDHSSTLSDAKKYLLILLHSDPLEILTETLKKNFSVRTENRNFDFENTKQK